MFKKISLRLGMEGGLNIGFCLGALVVAILMLILLLFISQDAITIIIVTVALILASLIAAGIVIYLQRTRKKSTDQLCTCRYRNSLYTYCRQCALAEKNGAVSDSLDKQDK